MTRADPWMCRSCGKAPVPAIGETLCETCAAEAVIRPGSDRPAQAVESAKAFLLASDEATIVQPDRAIAYALQGILVCQIELVHANAEALSRQDFMMPAGTIMLPEDSEPQPERGPKAWGQ